MAEIIYQTGVHHFGVRALGAANPFSNSGDEFGEIGVLYGRAAKRRWGHAAISSGLALTGFGSCDENGGCSTLGVPVVAEVAARLFSIVGVGAQAFGNLNTRSVYAGAVLFLQLGWLPSGSAQAAGDPSFGPRRNEHHHHSTNRITVLGRIAS